MSEKRFEITEYGSDYYIEIIDNEKELDESIDNPSQKLGLVECADLLNEQQSDLNYLARFIGEFKVDEFKEKLRTLRTLEDKVDEQQATISALKDIFKDIITYSKWDSEKPYCSLGIAVDKKTYYKIREILNE